MAKNFKLSKRARLKPIDLYTRYPHSDLLPIEPPTTKTTWKAFLSSGEVDNCGCGLFRFLAHELGDDNCTYDEQISRLGRAINDISFIAFQRPIIAVPIEWL